MRLGRVALQVFALVAAIITLAAPSFGDVPTFQEVVGHEFGERVTEHHEMVRYLEALARTSPRVVLLDQGESWEGRRLLLAIVTSSKNHGRLDEIQMNAEKLGEPGKTSSDEANRIIRDQPAIVWLGGSIHGFELSGSEGLLKLLERLTTRDDGETKDALNKTVVLIDPMLNPDGRDAFAQANHQNIGRVPNPAREDWANNYEDWDGLRFRTGHYYFDTNRDWFAHTQMETRNRVGTLQAWRPQALVDAHEMGADVEFFFDPPTDPYAPLFPDFAREWFVEYGAAYARAFDEAGFEYMTRERYNYFYPGYTTSYGSYQGAVGMLFEQGSSRGLALTRADESVRLLSDALEQQYTASWTTVRFSGENRERLLRDYYDAHVAAVEDGRDGVTRYLITPRGDPNLVAEAVNLLVRNGVAVESLTKETALSGVRDRVGEPVGQQSFPPGTFVVEAAQPRNRLIRTLLEPSLPVPEGFLEAARNRVDRGENPRFYDITSWSLPLLFNLDGYSSTDSRGLSAKSVSEVFRADVDPPDDRARYAYVFDGKQAASMAALFALKEAGYRAAVMLEPTTVQGRGLSGGSVIIRTGQNDENVHTAVRDAARRFRLDLTTLDTGHADPGFLSLGSGKSVPVKRSNIALLAGQPVHAYSFGWAWYTLDRHYEIPTTVIRAGSVAGTSLDAFNVVVVPHLFSAKELADKLGEKGVDRLKRWVQEGGALVAIGSGVDFVRKELELTDLGSWYPEPEEPEDGSAPGDDEMPQKFTVPGAFLRVALDSESWLTAGYEGDLPALVTSSRIYRAPDGPPDARKRVVGAYATEDLLLSGHAWPESLERLPGGVFLYEEIVGKGRVIAFAEDVNFRAYFRGPDRLFLNAVVLGPSAP